MSVKDEGRSDVAAMVAAQRAVQGLPPKITDPAALARTAELLLGPTGTDDPNRAGKEARA
jgi:hypothetical protein